MQRVSNRYRYAYWDGTQILPQLDADAVMSAIADDLLNHGDLEHALRSLMQRGIRSPERNMRGLTDYVRQLREKGLALDEAVTQAAVTRLRPVLMTTLVAALGFLPMAFSTGMGAEVQRPLATVVIGGVIGAMIMSLLVLRVLYMVFNSILPRRACPDQPVPRRACPGGDMPHQPLATQVGG